jgi:hypothetical protein
MNDREQLTGLAAEAKVKAVMGDALSARNHENGSLRRKLTELYATEAAAIALDAALASGLVVLTAECEQVEGDWWDAGWSSADGDVWKFTTRVAGKRMEKPDWSLYRLPSRVALPQPTEELR